MDLHVATDVRLRVEDTGGTGRPVVLIHGWPLSGAAWLKQVPELKAAGYRVVTYDRRGFGRSDKPDSGYDYDTLAADLAELLAALDLRDATLVGFSMGGGEVARLVRNHGEDRLRSVVFASAVTPFMMASPDNPEGPLTEEAAVRMEQGLRGDRDAFFERFVADVFSAVGELKVTEAERKDAVALCKHSGEAAALHCLEAFGTTDFREDLRRITVPALVIHGGADGIVPVEGSGRRTHAAIPGSALVLIEGAPHGCTLSHPQALNGALLEFLGDA